VDARFGDPPNAIHPVAALGRAVQALERRAPRDASARLRYGAAVAAALPVVMALAGAALARSVSGRGRPLRLAGEVVALSLTSASRALFERANEVGEALESCELDRARELLGRHLVSRDTATLTDAEVASATIESLAENLSDGVIAPL